MPSTDCSCHGFTVPGADGCGVPLMQALIPCVDQARDVQACLGLRPYTLALVHTCWAGGERGKGLESVLYEELILPVPKVEGLGGLQRNLRQQGLAEEGQLIVSEISPRYTEDQLVGNLPNGERIPKDRSFYWELRLVAAVGTPPVRRRFFPSTVPSLDMARMEWRVQLTKASNDRGRFFAEPRS